MKKSIFKSLFLYLGLFLSFLLMLSCIQLYFNANDLLGKKNSESNYWLTLSKTITPDNIGRKELLGFSSSNIKEIQTWKGVKKVFPIYSNDFKVSADGGSFIPFYTDMYLEAIDNEAIDVADLSEFQVKDNTIPIIISREYLNLYNYGFALNQGLPQITEDFAKKIEVNINLTLKEKNLKYKGKLIGLSDRIHSVLVPKNFLDSLNTTQVKFTHAEKVYSRVLIKVNDASDEELISKMNGKGYESNQESLRSAKIKGKLFLVLQAIALIGLFIFLLCMFMILNTIKIQFLEQKEAVSIKYTLGYSPRAMVNQISKKFSIYVFITVLLCLIVLSIFQYYFSNAAIANQMLSNFIVKEIWFSLIIVPLFVYLVVKTIIYRWLISSWNF
ncbi:MAG: ABC transporter permease [Flavobacterium sp.]|uniref:ABC transporter permease n=1 Tax=Flavobacterium sp. TaxID=239 RepID=UPI0035AE4031